MLYSLRIFLTSFPSRIIFWKIFCKLLGIKIPQKEKWQNLFLNKAGIEIGGPSPLFNSKGYLPVYPFIQSLDGVNFSTSTIWEGTLAEGNYYKYQQKTGYQYIAEGTSLSKIKDGQYDFVLSCNNLEHIANPLKAIFEWKRIIKSGGTILLVLPNKLANFDRKRPYTSIEHVVDDFTKNVAEDDMTHLNEILQLHDLNRDPQAGGSLKFKERCVENYQNRCIHHHVYNQPLLQKMFEYCSMVVYLQYSSNTDHYIAATKR